MDNKVSQAIPEATLQQALDHLTQVRALLAPYLLSLTPDERAKMPKMGEKSVEFVTKAADYSQSLAQLLPGYVDGQALQVDVSVYQGLLPLYSLLHGLVTDVDSTRLEAGSEGYTVALLVYAALQAAAQQNQPGAQAAVEALSTRFAAQRNNARKKKQAAS